MPISTLPAPAMKLWESVYNASKKAGDKVEVAAKKAWAAVKGGWKKGKDGKWVKKAELVEMSMYITKASITNGTMTWAAVNSDTDKDSYEERMSLELYKDFLANIEKGEIPEEFRDAVCSKFWCGGMPYISVSHYSDLNGKAVPGEPLEVYIDGDNYKAKLKAKGILYNNPLGRAVWRSLKEDKNKQPEEKIRISIGFLDMAHKHGENGNLFVRESLFSLCPECLQGVGDKIYVKGYLVHLALTRVPVNKRTEMVLEEKSMSKKKITRKDDAASIVGEDLAEKIDVEQKATSQKSDVLIEMSETEEETAELIAEVEAKTDAEEPSTDAEETVDEVAKETAEEPVEEKSTFEDDTMEKVVTQPEKYNENYPLNGATSMSAAEEYISAQKELSFVLQAWEVFSQVAWNIIQREDVSNKKEMFMGAVDEFRNLLSVKSMAIFSEAKEEHPLKPAIDALIDTIDNSIGKSVQEKSETINPAMQEFGSAITEYIESFSVVDKEEQPVPQHENKDTLLDDIKNIIQPLSESVAVLREEVSTLKSQASAKNVETRGRIPQPRTAVAPPNLAAKSEPAVKPGSLRDIINKSVGL